ncbi:MAG: M14 family zinc carboxypeptidase [Candidatus Thorarchaeota archaeon]
MRIILIILVLMEILAISSPIYLSFRTPIVFSSHLDESSNGDSNFAYTWIWEELANASGPIDGDDPVIWGSSIGPYYNYQELTNKLFLLQNAFPDFIDIFSIGQSHEGRELWTIRLTNRSVTSQKSEFHLVAHHHAREAITIENAIYFIDKLLNEVTVGNASITNLLANMEIYITPVLNPDGLETLSRFPWIRKNRAPIDDDADGNTYDELEIFDADQDGFVVRYNGGAYYEGEDGPDLDTQFGEDAPGGVDLNRNYDYEFVGSGSSANPPDFTYRGEEPFSEPETQAIRDFVKQHDFNFAISLHSGTRAVIAPWGYTTTPAPDHEELDAIVQKLKEKTGYPSWYETGGYNVNGEWGDWMYGAEGVFAFTLETYVDEAAWKRIGSSPIAEVGIWDYFNPPGNLILSESVPVWKGLHYILSEPRITITNEKPIIQVENPTGRFSGENITLTWHSEDIDNDSLLYNVYLSENGLSWRQIAESLETTSFELDTGQELQSYKSYYVKVSASDGIDAVFDIAEEKLMGQDAWDPVLNIEGLAAGLVLKGIQEFEVATANDSSVAKVALLIDGELHSEDNSPPFEFLWDTSEEFPGEHTITFIVYYIDGQTAKKEYNVYTFIATEEDSSDSIGSNQTESKETSHSIAGTMGFLLIAVIFIRKKRKKQWTNDP